MTPLAKIAIFGHPPQILHPPHRLSTTSLAGRKSVRIASLFSLFFFRYFSQLDQTNFSRFRRTLSTGFDCWLCYRPHLLVDLIALEQLEQSTMRAVVDWSDRHLPTAQRGQCLALQAAAMEDRQRLVEQRSKRLARPLPRRRCRLAPARYSRQVVSTRIPNDANMLSLPGRSYMSSVGNLPLSRIVCSQKARRKRLCGAA